MYFGGRVSGEVENGGVAVVADQRRGAGGGAAPESVWHGRLVVRVRDSAGVEGAGRKERDHEEHEGSGGPVVMAIVDAISWNLLLMLVASCMSREVLSRFGSMKMPLASCCDCFLDVRPHAQLLVFLDRQRKKAHSCWCLVPLDGDVEEDHAPIFPPLYACKSHVPMHASAFKRDHACKLNNRSTERQYSISQTHHSFAKTEKYRSIRKLQYCLPGHLNSSIHQFVNADFV